MPIHYVIFIRLWWIFT